MYTINIYTDGACSGNPGPGGLGYSIRREDGSVFLEGGLGFRRTTNNRMEILAAATALQRFANHLHFTEDCATRGTDIKVNVWSDSQVVVQTINEGWRRKANLDLWARLDDALSQFDPGTVTFHWVKGHADNPGNEQADRLAVQARLAPTEVDSGYEAIAGSPASEGPMPPEELFRRFVSENPNADSLEIALFMFDQGLQRRKTNKDK